MYTLKEAAELVKEITTTKFDASLDVDVHVILFQSSAHIIYILTIGLVADEDVLVVERDASAGHVLLFHPKSFLFCRESLLRQLLY